jgi:hypothetical protein
MSSLLLATYSIFALLVVSALNSAITSVCVLANAPNANAIYSVIVIIFFICYFPFYFVKLLMSSAISNLLKPLALS